ncbi:MAG: hypothetical protein WDO73_15840 [Ignavibacteriota bacterium]
MSDPTVVGRNWDRRLESPALNVSGTADVGGVLQFAAQIAARYKAITGCVESCWGSLPPTIVHG